jgi:putative DNA primase/helicase
LFFGVCPRFGNKGRFDLAWQIRTLRCLWADLDGCTPEQAVQRCAAQNMPDPTAIVSSGNGVHLYWLLDQPFLIDDVGDPPPVEVEWLVGPDGKRKPERYITDGKDRIYIDQRHHLTKISPKAQYVQDILAGIAQAIGGDHATDLTRLLRLPGTLNRKDERNGKSPIPSELVVIEPSRRYAIVDFDRFAKPVKAPSCDRLTEPEAVVLIPSECCSHVLSDDEIINLACKQRKTGAKFQALWSGDWTSHFNSPSEADASVVFTLAYYTKDAQQIDRLFRRSKLMRPKWDERHGSESYGQNIIAKALSKVTNQFTPTKVSSANTKQRRQPPADLGFPKPAIDWDFKSDQTENAMAVEFIDVNQTKLRYVPPWKKWLAWDGKRWKVDIDSGRTTRLARRLVRNYWDRLQSIQADKQQKDWADFCRWANRKTTIENVVSLARCDGRTTIDHELLNQDTNLLNLQNGTLDLVTRKFREHRQTDSITQIANVAFDPSAQCPKWRAFIDLIFGDDGEAKRYIQALLGYSCSGDVGEHILPICYGSGANGKSTLWNAIVEILGDYAMLAPSKLLLGTSNEHDTIIASLYQRRLVAISEPDEGSRLREARVKELTGDEHITARRMREDYWSFHRTHKFWLSTNHLPRINGTDEGIWRRIKLIPFRVDLRKVTEPIADYHKVLVREEGSGILNWLVEGFSDWRANGFIEPSSIIEETKSYRGKSDEIGRFIEECCLVDSKLVVPSSVLFKAYREWGGEQSQTRFSTLMQKNFVADKATSEPYRNMRVFKGVSLSGALEVEELIEVQKTQKTLGF